MFHDAATSTQIATDTMAADVQQPMLETGPYVLRTLMADVPVSADGTAEDIKINCVDYLGMRFHLRGL